jgi:hypothetical protein
MAAPALPSAFNFRTSFPSLVPGWLTTGNGYAYLYTLEACRDILCERAFEAMTIRLPGVGDPSNLPYLAFDRALQQGPAESNASFAGRLTDAFDAWGRAGSAEAVLEQLQAYMSNLQPGVGAALPLLTIVSNPTNTFSPIVTWTQLYQGDAQGAPTTVTTVAPGNFSWDGDTTRTWRRWLILPMALVAVPGLSGAAASTTTAVASYCFMAPGQNVGGVWVPATSGTPVNSPFLTIAGLSSLTQAQAGQWITLSGSANAGNNGTFPIVFVDPSGTSCTVANPAGVTSDAGPLAWTISEYPFIGPGPVWGLNPITPAVRPGYVFGQGQAQVPVLATSLPFVGTFDVTNGSTSVTAQFSQGGLMGAGTALEFTSQPGVHYAVAANSGTSITLAGAYSGASNAATRAQLVTIDTGSNIGGVWQPSAAGNSITSQPTLSWGLTCSSLVIVSIRQILKLWKSAGTYYPHIIVAFDCSTGAAGSAYSPNSTEGSGNPDGTFGGVGKLVAGVWVPNRLITSPFDCYCQGTGVAQLCSVENMT